jgi:dCMP deaminase
LSDTPTSRIDWIDFWLNLADQYSKRATCDRGRSGCVIVNDDNHLLTAGYVGSPPGMSHCDDVGHLIHRTIDENGIVSEHCVRTIHAEQNAILQAAVVGVSIKDATLYCRMTPCRTCAMFIIDCGIKKVVCEKKYRSGAESEKMFKDTGIELIFKSDQIQKYEGEK